MTTDLEPARVHLATRVAGIPGSLIDATISLLQDQPRDVISFAMGCPAPSALPGNVLAGIADRALREPDMGVLNYAATEGTPQMRTALRSMLADQLGFNPTPDQLLVTAGGMQGLDLAFKLLLDRGRAVVMESPTYTNATGTVTSYGGIPVEIPVDDEGMQVELIPAAVAADEQPPQAIHVIPNFQNPHGSTLSLERRLRLLELAEHYGCVIVEDDPYSLLRYEGEAVPSLLELSAGRVPVVYVGTFSKILAPGLRVGWVQAPEELISAMIDAKQGMDTCTNVVGQRLVSDFVAEGHLGGHLQYLRDDYRTKRDVIVASLHEHFDDVPATSWTVPAGGFFLWLTFDAVDAAALAAAALSEGVAVLPGSAFSPSGLFSTSVRLCFTFPDIAEIREGVRRLRVAYDRVAR